jgi:GntR family transcriptional regulator, hexuronate regulon transcriptional repressor
MSAPDNKRLYQQVAHAVADSIRSGQYPAGGRLPSERDLAETYDVSRPTVREAMIALEIQGFVEIRHGSGIHVTRTPPAKESGFDLDIGAFELIEARRLVEGETCALAAVSITDDEVAELERLLVEMEHEGEGASGQCGGDAAVRADRAFHLLIAGASRNSALSHVVEMLWDLRYRSPLCVEMLARAFAAGDRPRIAEHRAIVAALAKRDPKSARAAMRDHLSRVIDGVLEATESEALKKMQAEAAARRTAIARRAAI